MEECRRLRWRRERRKMRETGSENGERDAWLEPEAKGKRQDPVENWKMP